MKNPSMVIPIPATKLTATVQAIQPFEVCVEYTGNELLATSPISLVYATAASPKLALRIIPEYLDVLADHFLWLCASEADLAPHIQAELDLLREYLTPISDFW